MVSSETPGIEQTMDDGGPSQRSATAAEVARAVDVGGEGWFVGLTSAPLEALRRHGVDRTLGRFRVQPCVSTRVARAALKLLVRRGYQPTVASLEGRWLYVYKIEPWTVEDDASDEAVGVEIIVLAETPFSSTGFAWADHVASADAQHLVVSGAAADDIAQTEHPFDLIVRGDPPMRYRGCGPVRSSPEGVVVPFRVSERV